MTAPVWIFVIFIAAVAALFAVLAVRALTFTPRETFERNTEEISFDSSVAVDSLCEMIRCKTVSSKNGEEDSESEFLRFEALLPSLFPGTFAACTLEKPTERSLLLRWRGKSDSSPTVLMAHYDVVAAEESAWDKPPFDAVVENGVIWGRGALDTKASLNGILSAAEILINEGFVPENDIYFAFGGNEEINGDGASSIVQLFEQRGIVPALVCDEGGAVVENVFPGVKSPCALVGIAEKGMLNVEYSVEGGGGHSSAPAPHTPVGILAGACSRVESHPFPYHLALPAKKMLDTVGRHSTFIYKLVFANLWLFSPALDLLTRKTGGELNALVRTTTAFTQMQGSEGMNVIPPKATMVSNHRLVASDTTESALERIRKTVKDERVNIRMIDGMNPSPISTTDSEGYHRLSKVISATWQNAIVSPYLMLACSDARHWSRISDKVYRFSPMALSKEERATIHGNNERIPVSTLEKTVEFYLRLMRMS